MPTLGCVCPLLWFTGAVTVGLGWGALIGRSVRAASPACPSVDGTAALFPPRGPHARPRRARVVSARISMAKPQPAPQHRRLVTGFSDPWVSYCYDGHILARRPGVISSAATQVRGMRSINLSMTHTLNTKLEAQRYVR